MLLKDIVAHLESRQVSVELIGSIDVDIVQVAGLKQAVGNQITFLSDKKYLSSLSETAAGAVILQSAFKDKCKVPMLVVDNPYYVYALIAQLLNPVSVTYEIHPDASIHETVQLVGQIAVEAQAVIKENVKIGKGSLISAGAVLEANVSIGKNCRIGPNVVICYDCVLGNDVTIEAGTVIGGDGFGWAPHNGRWEKIPQVGRVIIGDNVSIGNNVCIDRGAIEDTVIANDCIIDNLVHIAHNVKIGEGSAIAGQVGFAGSTTMGAHCTVAGQAGFAGHLEIVDNAHFFAKAGVTHTINEPGVYSGFPAIPVAEWQKNSVRARGLDKMAKQLKQLQKQLDELTAKLES